MSITLDTRLHTLEQDCHAAALALQNASNLSGVVHTWSTLIKHLHEIANARGYGSGWVAHHPVNRLLAEKCLQLAGYTSAADYDPTRAIASYSWV